MKIKKGTNRLVFIFKKYVIKIPNFTYSWTNFITGILANLRENNTWKWNSGKYESGRSIYLCPVLFGCWGGWFIVMAKCDEMIGDVVRKDSELDTSQHRRFFPGDDHTCNYGFYKGRLVKLDYGSVDCRITDSTK